MELINVSTKPRDRNRRLFPSSADQCVSRIVECPTNAENPAGSPKAPPLAGANSVSGLHVDRKTVGAWTGV
jgi:hypothetical protein